MQLLYRTFATKNRIFAVNAVDCCLDYLWRIATFGRTVVTMTFG